MNSDEGDLWPDEITVDALSPAMILNQQAEALTRRTQGLVRGDLSVIEDPRTVSTLHFDLVAPAVPYRRRILVVRYNGNAVYPAVITSHDAITLSSGTHPGVGWGIEGFEDRQRPRVSYTPSEFEKYVAQILSSGRVKSAVLALIAKTNDVRRCFIVRNDSGDSVTSPAASTESEPAQPDESPPPAEDSLPADDTGDAN
jgi:hypothetical protein